MRRLASYGNASFTYGADGIRTSKTYNGLKTTYTLDGNRILKESNSSKTLAYYYGTNGVIGFRYNGADYYYQKNLQGDVIAIYNASGVKQAEYQYDAWGKLLNVINCGCCSNIGTINPFRYRGYYYDVETGLYYLQTRYYDPEVGRFINSDSIAYFGDGTELSNYNLFAYCGDNPVSGYDPTGKAWWHWAIGAAIVVGCAALTVATCGGSLAIAAASVTAVASGSAAFAGTAATVSAGMFIGSATTYGVMAFSAMSTSDSIEEFNEKGNWATVAFTAGGGAIGSMAALSLSKPQEAAENSTDLELIGDALKQLDSSGLRPGQTILSASGVMEKVNNYDPVNFSSSVYTAPDGTRYLTEGHHTTVASTILGKGTGMNMGKPATGLPSATDIYWTKEWYEFWKKAIEIVE